MADNIVHPIGNNSIHERASILDESNSNSSSNSQYSNVNTRQVDTGTPASQWASSMLSALGPPVDESRYSVDNHTLPAPIITTKTKTAEGMHFHLPTASSPLPSTHTLPSPGVPGGYPYTPTDENESTTVKGILGATSPAEEQEQVEDEDITYVRKVASSTLSTAKEYAVSASHTVASAGQTMAHAASAASSMVATYLPGTSHTTGDTSDEYQRKPEDNTLLQHPPPARRSSPHEQDKTRAIAHETGALAAQALVRPQGSQITQEMRDTAAINPNLSISDSTSGTTMPNNGGNLAHPTPQSARADSGHSLDAGNHGTSSKGSAPTPSVDGASENASTRTLLGSKTALEPPNLPTHSQAAHLGPSNLAGGSIVGDEGGVGENVDCRADSVHNPDGTQKTSSSASANVQRRETVKDVGDGEERPPLEQHHRDSTRHVPLAGAQQNWESSDSTTATPGHEGSRSGQQRGMEEDQKDTGPISKLTDRAAGKATDVGMRGAGTSHSMDKVKAEQKHQQQTREAANDEQHSKEGDTSSTMHPGVFTSSNNTAGRTHPNTSPPPSHHYTASSRGQQQQQQPETITNPTTYRDDKAAQELYEKRDGAGLVGEAILDNGAATTSKPGFMTMLKGEMKVLTGKIGSNAEKVEEGRKMMGKN